MIKIEGELGDGYVSFNGVKGAMTSFTVDAHREVTQVNYPLGSTFRVPAPITGNITMSISLDTWPPPKVQRGLFRPEAERINTISRQTND